MIHSFETNLEIQENQIFRIFNYKKMIRFLGTDQSAQKNYLF